MLTALVNREVKEERTKPAYKQNKSSVPPPPLPHTKKKGRKKKKRKRFQRLIASRTRRKQPPAQKLLTSRKFIHLTSDLRPVHRNKHVVATLMLTVRNRLICSKIKQCAVFLPPPPPHTHTHTHTPLNPLPPLIRQARRGHD